MTDLLDAFMKVMVHDRARATRPGDLRQRRPDRALAQAHFGWQASTPLTTGLPHTIACFDELLTKTGEKRV